MGGTHATYAEYFFDTEVMVAIDLTNAVQNFYEFWNTPAKAVLTWSIVPPECIIVIVSQQAKDPLAEPLFRNYYNLKAVDRRPGGDPGGQKTAD